MLMMPMHQVNKTIRTSLRLIRQMRRFVRDLGEFVVRFWLACSMVAFCWLCRDGRDRGSGSCFVGTCCKYVVRSGVRRLRDVGVRFAEVVGHSVIAA